MSDLTKDEAANLDWALMALAKNAGYVLPSEKATAIQEVLETQEKRIAALERENSELRELCRIASGPLAELNKIRLQSEPEGYYVEELCEGRWSRCALGFMWAKEDDARTQLEELRRRYGGRCFRLHGDYSSETSGICPHGMPLAENICGICSEGKPNRPAQNTEDRCEHGVWKADHCYQCAKSEKE